jgi:hypothetical protein
MRRDGTRRQQSTDRTAPRCQNHMTENQGSQPDKLRAASECRAVRPGVAAGPAEEQLRAVCTVYSSDPQLQV